ncbi:zinc-dependent alcohol dehydrogenase [Frondihabitans australicus]|uniref:2-desacetyl-2-hydroxyethyl bacteriochlorophyllide A dehydrogenase n=1 Tax=Frondihabitans australicus TaxID=386892 RepID=A0A495IHR2_9MICO|nr:zinc-binding alcohol dehydrogenase [Frondihabitans australicus]RKR75250.1 2-desacetyl-2-hydroxyethyl bacteriochlorophyllide A dehydrogenase [Frondihabitans australicus]
MTQTATAFVVDAPGRGSLQTVELPDPAPGDVVVRTLWTGISRGTETTVFTGRVPESERERMRAPFQRGEFPGPVMYGYLNVGVVEQGPAALMGREVFCLSPHQSRYVVPASGVLPLPDGVPARRAVLAGAVETAVTVLWDAEPLVGDRIAVIGGGMIGAAICRLLRALPGVEVTLVDVDESKRDLARSLGVGFATPDDAPAGQDIVINASGSGDGLQLGLRLVADEGEVIEASWYGDREVTLRLGEDFHSRRLSIRASQVGRVPARRRGSRSTRDRLALALLLLRDPAFDTLLTGTSGWQELPDALAALASGRLNALCHTIDWSAP